MAFPPDNIPADAGFLALPLDLAPPRMSPEEALAARVRLVLESAPGLMPWRPGFGCDLSDALGAPVTPERTASLGRRIQTALQKQVPGVLVRRCTAAMVGARLSVDLELQTAEGPLTLAALLSP